jgi:Flp pilus assembly protein TadD
MRRTTSSELGRTHLRRRHARSGDRSAREGKRREPQSRSIREALGIAYFRIGRWAEAEAEFRALVELAPRTSSRTTRSVVRS